MPLAVQGTFTYLVPADMEFSLMRGARVYVPFGKSKLYTGIVTDIHDVAPKGFEAKPIAAMLDHAPIVRHPQVKFWQWMAQYYLCTIGEVFKAALPTGLKVESETMLSLAPDTDTESMGHDLNSSEIAIIDQLTTAGSTRLSDLRLEVTPATVLNNVNRLLEKGLVIVDRKATSTYRPKKVKMVLPAMDFSDSSNLHIAMDKVASAPKQEVLLLAYLDLVKGGAPTAVERDKLLSHAQSSVPILRMLEKKGILREEAHIINRFKKPSVVTDSSLPPLSDIQREALRSMGEQWGSKDVVLLHGVTGSGKTELYCHAIQTVLKAGQQALMLVPEISLTTQLTDRLRRIFGDKLLVYHSKFSDSERVDIWQRLRQTHEPLIVLGVRSSVFLPYAKLGLVVVDEEHDASYKQNDPAPRYNGRDAAIMLAHMHGAKTVLGSATPAIDTYYKATTGKYGLVELTERFQGVAMPQVEVVDMIEQQKRRTTDGLLAAPTIINLQNSLARGHQAIIFQNRRGYAPSVFCTQCGWQPKCRNCDVSLVYHRRADILSCHYCGYQVSLPRLCPACGQNSIRRAGFGTERIADHVAEAFPEARVSRMDLDTTRNKDGYQRIIEEFAGHKTDFLVGTQMVSKGLDFGGVDFVGVVNADSLLHFPDFRANERAYNMLVQVAGRAGRRQEQGKVTIQTYDAANPLLDFVKRQDYAAYYEYELELRRQFGYPPFSKIIMLYIKHRSESAAEQIAIAYAAALRNVLGDRVLGPARPGIGRIANQYIQTIMLKVETGVSMSKVKNMLQGIYAEMTADARMRTAQVYYDVDPA